MQLRLLTGSLSHKEGSWDCLQKKPSWLLIVMTIVLYGLKELKRSALRGTRVTIQATPFI